MNNHFSEAFNLPSGVYLLSHSVGCLPKKAQTALQERYLTPWQNKGGDAWPLWLEVIQDFCNELGLIMGASANDICPQANVSSAFTKYLLSLPIVANKNVILMHASAFPSLGFVAKALEQYGYQFELINEDFHPRDLAAWQQHIGEQTAAVLITHVHSNTGTLSPVKAIRQLAQSKQAKVIVDVAQSIGVVPFDVTDWAVDCIIGSCVKWLCAGPGAGFMWLEPNSIDALHPRDVGWFSHANPFEFDIRHFEYAQGAKRFWGGTPNIASYALALGSLQLINQISVAQIAQHNHSLKALVYHAAAPLLKTRHELTEQGGTLCLDFAETAQQAFVNDLQKINAHFDCRTHVIRLSFHIYNTQAQAEQLADLLKQLRL